jgi:hypothetical protein
MLTNGNAYNIWAAYAAAFKSAQAETVGYLRPNRTRPAAFKPGIAR